jgi:glyceraldehyde-3-phosphate dehydrogenase (NAD(P))
MKKISVAVNGYGVIGKRVADAIVLQNDMELAGVCDVVTDWRIKVAAKKQYPVFAFDDDNKMQMTNAGLDVKGNLGDLIKAADVMVDCTPKKIAAKNIEKYNNQDESR